MVSMAASVASICCNMASTMGTIMAVVAVLLIHMERKAVTPMKPSINLQRRGREKKRGAPSLKVMPAEMPRYGSSGEASPVLGSLGVY